MLFGGQESRYGSPCFADQLELWRDRAAVHLSVRESTIAATISEMLQLQPRRGDGTD